MTEPSAEFNIMNLNSESSSPSSSAASIISLPSPTTLYIWTIDFIWRNHSWKDIPVHFDKVAGFLYFFKPGGKMPFHTLKFLDVCFGVQENFDESMIVLHVLSVVKGLDQLQSSDDHHFCYFADQSEMDRFRIVLSNALHEQQKKRRFMVVVNRESGQGRAGQVLDSVVKPMLNAASCSHFVKESEYNRHIPLFASQFDAASVDGIILIGGDGTVNEFLNGLFSRKDWSSIQNRLLITLVPCGVKLQLAARLNVGDASLAVFSALRAKSYLLYPIAFVQARRRFYGHTYLQITPKKRTYIKFYYLNSNPPSLISGLEIDTESQAASSVDSIVLKGPALRYYHKFTRLDEVGKDISSASIAIGPHSDLQLTNTFDPSQSHPLALMSQSTRSGPLQRLWSNLSCHRFLGGTGTDSGADLWPKMLAMTRAGFLQIEDNITFPPSLNKDRWFVDGELIGTESVYFESLDIPVRLTIPPDYILESKIQSP